MGEIDPLKSAILAALKEEQNPRSAIALKSLGLGILLSTIFVCAFFCVWHAISVIAAVGLSLLILFVAGFSLQFFPQPRIEVAGYWSPWTMGRALVWMAALSALQLLICPDLAGVLEVPSAGLSSFTHVFMQWGGMQTCMMMCGVLFSGMSSAIVFYSLRRVAIRSRLKSICAVAAVVFLGQAPVIICQIFHHVDLLGYWAAGSMVSIGAVALFFCRAKALTE
jgi:hypothetical protein